MLLELSVQNLALIDHVRLELRPGLTVLTGETGAGKSILLDAIGLILGNRASSDLVRKGADRCVVEALVEVPAAANEAVQSLLDAAGIELDPAEPLVISREVHATGRTVCRVNARMATVQMLRELGSLLVQQHGQHDHQGLLRQEEQLRLLDLYGRHQELLDQVRSSYRRWIDAKAALEQAAVNEQERMRRMDMLAFQIREIEEASLRAGEEEELRAARQRLQYADKIAGAVKTALEALSGDDARPGVSTLLASAAREVAAAATHDAALTEVKELMETAEVNVDEALRSLFRYLDTIEADPDELAAIEDRLALIRTLERKYGASVEAVLAHLDAVKAAYESLVNHEARMLERTQAVEAAQAELAALCKALHEARQSASTRLSAEVQRVLRELDLPNASLHIVVEPRLHASGEPAFGPHGADEVAFLFSANRGESPKPLQKIASGGELSRTLLAFKAVLAEVDALDTLIFDEIDVGVSGSAAQRIAEQLQKLGRVRQILCVTHSPQVAAAGDDHFCIEKSERAEHTTTVVHRLDFAGRVAEIARLVGAGLAGQTAVDHAEALLRGFHPVQ
ncbi:DNA repair protein RecN [Alicyclobacillus cycloheptanicus]|uniref:DNA repair protein RecN n=1 Tax=Alicyclobacillus cycloheptanicus TaxID=1457 RepID=A0ABT9XE74_9BACL|nr:DNA repair protein RecN [Alicyclobacillus cycloheptanicus]MDQ0188374.1 DNA repair protein RecN (Recombination protein N) [Alicyclobacillus cycloheptanicus]WDM01080.1 DNA repair protein RecN [Alicyclobacillus cycloheptanicus]